MSGDRFDRLPINEDLDSFDLGKIEGEGIDDGIDRHDLVFLFLRFDSMEKPG